MVHHHVVVMVHHHVVMVMMHHHVMVMVARGRAGGREGEGQSGDGGDGEGLDHGHLHSVRFVRIDAERAFAFLNGG